MSLSVELQTLNTKEPQFPSIYHVKLQNFKIKNLKLDPSICPTFYVYIKTPELKNKESKYWDVPMNSSIHFSDTEENKSDSEILLHF